MKLEGLYNYLFWYNEYQELWYAIPHEKYVDFFSGKRNKIKGLKKNADIKKLINSL